MTLRNNLYSAVPIAMATAVLATAAMTLSAAARDDARGMRQITACSTYGRHGCVTAQVRVTNLGPQYRRPGGSWTWCEHDCRDTLRRHTIDFWDTQRESNK